MHGHVVLGQTSQQGQPMMQFSQADTEEMKKKRHFEEQQRRLMALKGGQAPGKIQVDNPLNDLFGKKAPNSTTSSLLGAVGDASRPRNNSVGLSATSGMQS